jgi:hypothetical protein
MKKQNHIYLIKHAVLSVFSLFLLAGLTSCEDVIDLNTATGPTQLVVDGWINNQPGNQKIKLTWSANYFDNSAPKPVQGAEVTVTDNLGNVFVFEDLANDGNYIWKGTGTDTLGKVGRTYALSIKNGEDVYTASSEIKRVPKVDSVVYQKETLPFKPDKGPKEGYIASFYARDLPGEGDRYWIKPVVSGKIAISKASDLTVAYDAGPSAGAPSDGLIFILPLRQAITRDSLYLAGASVGVELHSITPEAFEFIKQVAEQGSNGGLFATPVANVKSNVTNTNPNGIRPLGFFGATAVSRMETTIDPAKARPED